MNLVCITWTVSKMAMCKIVQCWTETESSMSDYEYESLRHLGKQKALYMYIIVYAHFCIHIYFMKLTDYAKFDGP